MEEIKKIKPTYPMEFSIGVLLLVFAIAAGLSRQIFQVSPHDHSQDAAIYFGMFLVGIAVVTMVLIMWEEILFPVSIKVVKGGMMFKNHRTKLKVQLFIYCTIPVIFTFIHLTYDINPVRFYIWAAFCMILPIAGKIASGLNNYNDFLRLTTESIEYKNNEKEGHIDTKDIQHISIIKQKGKIMSPKIHLLMLNNETIVIDLDEMELDAFYDSIFNFISIRYRNLVKETK